MLMFGVRLVSMPRCTAARINLSSSNAPRTDSAKRRETSASFGAHVSLLEPEVAGGGLVDGREQVVAVHDERLRVQRTILTAGAGGAEEGFDQRQAGVAHLVLLLAIAVALELQVRRVEGRRRLVEASSARR